MKKQLIFLFSILSQISLVYAHEGPGKPHKMHGFDWILLIFIIIISLLILIFLIKKELFKDKSKSKHF